MAYVDNTILKSTLTKIKTWAEGLFVQKESGKRLSTNDFTNAYKGQLDTLDTTYAKKADISSIYRYKGTVENYAALPSSDQQIGDAYNVTAADSAHGIKAGDNVVWNGTAWDNLSGTVDLTNYALKTELPTNTSDLTNDSGFLTEIPSEYVTDSELTGKGYQTSSQVQSAIAAATGDFLTEIPAEYVTETELTGKGYQTSAQVTQAISTATANMVETDDLASYALKSELPVAMQQNELEQIWTEVMGA